MTNETEDEDDVKAISALFAALKPLNAESRVHVLEFVIKRLNIPLAMQNTASTPTLASSHAPTALTTSVQSNALAPHFGLHDIRTFAAEKKPKTVNERVAVIGFYLAQLAPDGERRDYLTSEDIKTYFIQAGFELPTAPPNMTLTHAKNAGYLNALDRGQYKLNAVGHNLVVHKLPSGEIGDVRSRAIGRKSAKKKTTVSRKVKS
jgi:hypothetical protein